MGFWDAVAICRQSAPHLSQITTPTCCHSIFTDQGPDLQNILRFIVRLS